MKPRRLVHRGTILASAFWINEPALGAAVARRRILELASVQEVRRIAGGLFVRLQNPQWISSDSAPGTPLVSCREVFLGMPLDPDELDEIAAPSESVILVQGGEIVVLPLDSCPLEDLSTWIDLSDWKVENVKPLGQVWVTPKMAPQAKEIDPRKEAGIGAAPPEAIAAREALLNNHALSKITADEKGRGFGSAIFAGLASLFSSLAAKLGRSASGSSGQSTTRQALVAAPITRPPENTWRDRLRMALNTAAARFLVWANLAASIGRKQAEYLEKTLEYFDSGNLEEALRHAIPLGSGDDKPKPLALSVPTPRADLAIRTTKTEATSALGFGGGVFDALRTRYRKAIEQLEKQGKIKEAAFVLAELLGESEEAVSFLEKHGLYQMAAELAEGRNLDPALVVRQWILAGNRARAILIARRTGAFSTAIAKLEPSHPEQAGVLRILWANQLAASGAYGAAVQTIWPVEKARHLARDWLDRGIAIGGVPAARLLATKAWLLPDEFANVVPHVRTIREHDADEARAEWLALAQSILANPTSKTMRILARTCARALMGEDADPATKTLTDRLVTAAADPVLLADLRRQDRDEASIKTLRFDFSALCDVGLARNANEDGYFAGLVEGSTCSKLADTEKNHRLGTHGALFLVADGMGGFQACEVVDVAIGALTKYIATADKRQSEIGTSLTNSLKEANAAIFKKAAEDRKFLGCGATMTAAWLVGNTLWVAQVGDTRAYLFRDDKLQLLTKDHSLLNELLSSGQLLEEDAKEFEHRSIITRALGVSENLRVDIYRTQLLDNDRILLCTDGIHGMIEDTNIRDIVQRRENDPGAICKQLKGKAFEAGAHDNMAMMVVDIHIRQNHPAASRQIICEAIVLDEPLETQPPEFQVFKRELHDIGAMGVRDAAVLPGGRLLVALGEGGVRLISPEGKTLVHFDQPAERIVLSDHGDRAIIVARRGSVCRTARIDLVRRKAERWFDARLDYFANSFDGSIWFVSNEQGVFAVDALEDQFASIWELREPDCLAVSRSSTSVSLLIGREVWTFDLPSFRLRNRHPLAWDEKKSTINITLASNGTALCWLGDEETKSHRAAFVRTYENAWNLLNEDIPKGESHSPHVVTDDTAHWSGFYNYTADAMHIKVFNLQSQKLQMVMQFDGQFEAHGRFQEGKLVIADMSGRVLVIDVVRSRLVNEWRI